jgi:hypothetical protein
MARSSAAPGRALAPRSAPAPPLLLQLQRSYGNQAVCRMLGRAGGQPVLARVIDDNTAMQLIQHQSAITDDTKELTPLLEALLDALLGYLGARGNADAAERLNDVRLRSRAVNERVTTMREDRSEHKTDLKFQSVLGQISNFTRNLSAEAGQIVGDLIHGAKGERYKRETEPRTGGAIAGGDIKHLLITPRPGTREAEGAGQQYPTDIKPEQEMTLALPPKSNEPAPFGALKVTGAKPPVLEVLAIGGGHGGVQALFDQAEVGSFSADYWSKNVVGPLAAQGVTAKLIVLDACLTASMIGVFAPLCAPQGQIIASMYSINARLMTPEAWTEILAAESEGKDVGAIVERRGRELAASSSQAAGVALVDKLRSTPGPKIAKMVAEEPLIGPLVSRLRYLPKISNYVAAYVRAKNQARRQECLKELEEIKTDMPTPDDSELGLLDLVIDLLPAMPDEAVNVMRVRLQEITKSPEVELAALERTLLAQVTHELGATPAAAVPAQTAVYDAETHVIRFDKAFLEAGPRRHVELSTGKESRGEMKGIDASLAQFASTQLATLDAVPMEQIFDKPKVPIVI